MSYLLNAKVVPVNFTDTACLSSRLLLVVSKNCLNSTGSMSEIVAIWGDCSFVPLLAVGPLSGTLRQIFHYEVFTINYKYLGKQGSYTSLVGQHPD